MAKKARIVGGTIQQFYHTIPEDKDFIITSPNKEAIFKFLGQIGPAKFPEFIRDVLVKVEKHTLIDITDGPGDEKQDLLTLTADGHRCLTQCKHSVNVNCHYNGDELDRIVSACIRKDCKDAIFVTNTDLTPQAKRYVTDKEYLRGWSDKADPLVIDYWNDGKIWERIKNNSDILNKWFGSLGQTHGLRNFKFELSVQTLPFNKNSVAVTFFNKILNQLSENKKVAKSEKTKYVGKLNDGTVFYLENWFQFTTNLNINYIPLDNSGNFLNAPFFALAIEVNIPHDVKYSPTEIRQKIVDFLLKDSLEALPKNNWWHITTSQAKSFIFLHDIGETRQITLNSAETFVKINDEVIPEMEYIALNPSHFELKIIEEDDSIFIHKLSGIQVIQLFDQPIDPYHVYEQQLIQLANLDQCRQYSFKAVEGIDSHLMMRVRKILNSRMDSNSTR
ncbi:MAG: restriction endonuclease [Mangrovibacterium sp.]